MESALTPREIQARIRAGSSVVEVAQAAGVPVEKIEPFAAPVLAEREFIATRACAQHVRRGSETLLHRSLEQVVAERLNSRGIDATSLQWDAWKIEDRRWTLQLTYASGRAQHEALFIYDQDGRFSQAHNEDARWLLGLQSAAHGSQPGRSHAPSSDEVTETTLDLNSELDLVRVVQPSLYDTNTDTAVTDSALPTDDAYVEADLSKEDSGIYDVIPRSASEIDVLYDMLSGLDEDSVEIYTELLADEDVRETLFESEPETPQVAESEPPVADSAKKPAKKSRRRAKVPSWDEIVFGSPKR